MENQERHYNINRLNIIFALTSVILFSSLVWLFWNDYARSWKKYQKEFHELEIEKTRVKYDAASHELEKNEQYQALKQQRDTARKEYETNCPDVKGIDDELKKFKAENDLLAQNLKFKKAELDAARFRLEEASARTSEDLPQAKEEFDKLTQRVEELKISIEKSDQEIFKRQSVLDQCNEKLKELDRQERQLAKQVIILKRKLAKIDPLERSFINQIADVVRNLPIFDLANPQYKIEQVVLKNITDDVNFMRVPKVERCTTCHLGISNPDYKDAPQPFTTHPRLELFVGNNSPHGLEEMGCTVCHGGRDRGTDFISAAHTPNSQKQAREWKEKYNWHELHHWSEPMVPAAYIESSCFKCHQGETTIKGAEKLNLGLNLIEKAGCYGCHNIDRYKNWPKTGPDLTKVSSKLSEEWVYRWIQNPRSFREHTWMPTFFNQSNTNDPRSLARTNQEIHAMVHYLFESSKEFPLTSMPEGNSERGKEIVASIGCFACHQIESPDVPTTRDSLRREHGPNFTGIGSKTSKEWIFNWLKNPSRYHRETKMPSLRLSDQEAADVTSYLSSLKKDEFNTKPIDPINPEIIDEVVLNFLIKAENIQTARAKLAQMSLEEKLSFAGQKLIRHHGCFGCHNISGLENEKPIGTDLTYEGSKPVDRLDFGFIDIEHTNRDWFRAKFKNPRIFDEGKIKAHDEKLRMPNFYFNDEEVAAIVTAILGFVEDRPKLPQVTNPSIEDIYLHEGRLLIRHFNCQGCHILEGEGGAIQESVKNWLVEYGGRAEAEAGAVIKSFSPPNLIGEGKKVHSEWLFNFLHDPAAIRPWLKVRMPTYPFDTTHLNTLVKYFNALDHEDFPFSGLIDTTLTPEEHIAAEKLFSNNYFGCAQCHIVGDKLPAGSPDSWAPNFALAKERLKPQWIIEWLTNPQDLLPGTKMPTYFDPGNFASSGPEDILEGNEAEQIRVLRNYLLTLGGNPKATAQETPAALPQETIPEVKSESPLSPAPAAANEAASQ